MMNADYLTIEKYNNNPSTGLTSYFHMHFSCHPD